MTNRRAWFGVFLAAFVLSRLGSAIHYIEDPDSLRFALAVQRYSLVDHRPHFPGYPVFCGVVWTISRALGGFAAGFSLVGALAGFTLAWTSGRIAQRAKISREFQLAWWFLLPLPWLLANRYMPDLMGAALAWWIHDALANPETSRHRRRAAFVLAGMAPGVRLSIAPLLLPSLLAALAGRSLEAPRRAHRVGPGPALGYTALGLLSWFIPVVLLTGPSTLLALGVEQFTGHFTDFGGSIWTESAPWPRVTMLTQTLLADGLGAGWLGRHWLTWGVSLSLALISLLALGNRNRGSALEPPSPALRAAAVAAGIYLIWIFLGQNLLHKSRHVLPLLPPLTLLFGLWHQRLPRHLFPGALSGALLTFTGIVTFTLVEQHRHPSAMAQAVERVSSLAETETVLVLADPLVQHFFSAQRAGQRFQLPEDSPGLQMASRPSRVDRIVSIGRPAPTLGLPIAQHSTFFHNPFVNRLWPQVELYEYQP